jgi:branched-chain amino acid transport system substrate-binding protein
MTQSTRRTALKSITGMMASASAPAFYMKNASASTFRNDPGDSKTVTIGLTLPLTGAYADEGKDELRAYELAIKHINGEGDGGMLKTMKPSVLKGNGILGKKVVYVQGDTQTKTDVARGVAKRMMEKDGAIMCTGGSSSGEAIAMQSLAQEMGVIFMNCLTHSNDTTGKDKRRYGFRHFFNAYMSCARQRVRQRACGLPLDR